MTPYQYVHAKCAEFKVSASHREKRLLVQELLPGEEILAVVQAVVPLSLGRKKLSGQGLAVATTQRVLFLRHGWADKPKVTKLPFESILSVHHKQGWASDEVGFTRTAGKHPLTATLARPTESVSTLVEVVRNHSGSPKPKPVSTDATPAESTGGSPHKPKSVLIRHHDEGDAGADFLPHLGSDRNAERVLHIADCEFSLGIRQPDGIKTVSGATGTFAITVTQLSFSRQSPDGTWTVAEVPIESVESVEVEGDGSLRISGAALSFCTVSGIKPDALVPMIAHLQSRTSGKVPRGGPPQSHELQPDAHTRKKLTDDAEAPTDAELRENADPTDSIPDESLDGSHDDGVTVTADATEKSKAGGCLKVIVVLSIIVVIIITAIAVFDSGTFGGRRYSDGWQTCRSSEGGSSAFYMNEEKETQGFDPCRRYSNDSWARRPTPTPVRVDYEFPRRP